MNIQNSIFGTNLIVRSDSYKVSHPQQLPPGTTGIYSYLESRGGLFPETVFFGLNYYLKEYLSRQITMADVDYAESRITKHLGPGVFNRKLWERVVTVHNGFLPIRIKAVKEGTVKMDTVITFHPNGDRKERYPRWYCDIPLTSIPYNP